MSRLRLDEHRRHACCSRLGQCRMTQAMPRSKSLVDSGTVKSLPCVGGDKLWKEVESRVAPGGRGLAICVGSNKRIKVRVIYFGRPLTEVMNGYLGCLRRSPRNHIVAADRGSLVPALQAAQDELQAKGDHRVSASCCRDRPFSVSTQWDTEVRPVLDAVYQATRNHPKPEFGVSQEDINKELGREGTDLDTAFALDNLIRGGYLTERMKRVDQQTGPERSS